MYFYESMYIGTSSYILYERLVCTMCYKMCHAGDAVLYRICLQVLAFVGSTLLPSLAGYKSVGSACRGGRQHMLVGLRVFCHVLRTSAKLSLLFTFCNCIVPMGFLPWEIQVAFPRESQLQQSCATQPKVHAGSFSVSIIHQTLRWTTGSLTCAQM